MLERQKAADELKVWRNKYKDFLDPFDATEALHLEIALRNETARGPLGSRHVNYPDDADKLD